MHSDTFSKTDNISKRRRCKAKNDAITFRSDHNRLRLVFSYGGKRHFIALEMADTPLNRVKAQEIAFQVQRDIEYGEFDPTYRRYKAKAGFSTIEDVVQLASSSPCLKELWQQYVEVRRVGKALSTIRMYGWVANHLDRCPHDSIEDAQTLFDWFVVNVPADSTKRVLTQLSSCCRWAKKSGKINNNPFMNMAAEIKVPSKVDLEEDSNLFSRQERDRIITAFQQSHHYSYYAPLIEFLFLTRCRPSEALALMWKTVGETQIKFEQALVYNGHTLVVKSGLKTQRSRKFPINAQLTQLLQAIKPQHCDSETLVFPSKKGRFINWSNFNTRGWKKILASLPDIEYRNPYQTRHTFCSLCREADIASIQIAKWVGNSPEMIDRIYARPTDHIQVPEF
ncbi:MAG: tyrosine-type recombinase/integrase [Cyanobacteria bacterium P01_F01_bin.150]